MQLRAGPQGLEILGLEELRTEAPAGIEVSEPLGGAPRTLGFADGARCEVPQGPELERLLAALGHRDRAVIRWQRSWRYATAALVAVAVVLAAGYRWGLPWAATQIAPHIPPALVARLSDEVVVLLDRRMLAPSGLAAARREEIERRFGRLVGADPELDKPRLLFRHGGAIGANAFALPDGRIVLLDGLVALTEVDDEVLAVLAHELGHVRYRHGLRQLIQSSVVAAIVAGYVGDISTLLSGLTTLLLESGYSRDFEREADDYGARLLNATGIQPEHLATMLAKLERAHAARPERPATGSDWLSSHPETAARIARLRNNKPPEKR